MEDSWDQARLQQLIDNQEPESLRLEYKGSGSLDSNNNHRDEITKDVSAMANADGGIVIFGISCPKAGNMRHLPEALDPIDGSKFSVEWLGQKLDLISPRLNREIIPVEINNDPNKVVYVVNVPKSTTAHQATDLKYYKRYDARSLPMADYEIRDVMGRSQHPAVELGFKIRPKYTPDQAGSANNHLVLDGTIHNTGSVMAQYITTFIHLPKELLRGIDVGLKEFKDANDMIYCQFTIDNQGMSRQSRQGVLLPQVSSQWFEIRMASNFDLEAHGETLLIWRIHVDNAPPTENVMAFKDIPFTPLSPTNGSLYFMD